MGLYDSPIGEQHIAYPVDKCVNVAAGLTGSSYGIYTCNDDGLTVTYTHYEDDASCSDVLRATTGATYTMDNIIPGDLFSFNCQGTDSFIESKSVINDPTCCNGAPVFTQVAVGVCHRDISGNFVMYVYIS